MIIKQVQQGIQRIINLGNYENVRYESTMIAEVEAGESPADVYNKLAELNRANIAQEMDRLAPKKK